MIKIVCKKLIDFRGEKSQQEMAKMYGVSQQAWSKYERGIMLPSFHVMLKLEKDIGIPMEQIFFETLNYKKQLKETEQPA